MKLRLTAFAGKPNDEQWNTNFQLLEAYVKEHQAYPSTDSGSLGDWLSNQRRAYKRRAYNNETLSKERIDSLESLSKWSPWSWDPLTDKWNENFQLLQAYLEGPENEYNEYPSTNTPDGKWLSKQRSLFSPAEPKPVNNSQKNNLSDEEITRRKNLLKELPNWDSWFLGTGYLSEDEWLECMEAFLKTIEYSRPPNVLSESPVLYGKKKKTEKELGVYVKNKKRSPSLYKDFLHENNKLPDLIEERSVKQQQSEYYADVFIEEVKKLTEPDQINKFFEDHSINTKPGFIKEFCKHIEDKKLVGVGGSADLTWKKDKSVNFITPVFLHFKNIRLDKPIWWTTGLSAWVSEKVLDSLKRFKYKFKYYETTIKDIKQIAKDKGGECFGDFEIPQGYLFKPDDKDDDVVYLSSWLFWKCNNSEHAPFAATLNNVKNVGTWCPYCNSGTLYTKMGKESETLIWKYITDNIDKSSTLIPYNNDRTGCDFVRYKEKGKNKILTFFEIKTQFLASGESSEPFYNLKELKESQELLRNLVINSGGEKDSFLKGLNELGPLRSNSKKQMQLKIDLNKKTAIKDLFDECTSVEYCIIVCGFYIKNYGELSPQNKFENSVCKIKFPNVGYFGDGTTASDTGFKECTLEVPKKTAEIILEQILKNNKEAQKNKIAALVTKLRIGRWIKQ